MRKNTKMDIILGTLHLGVGKGKHCWAENKPQKPTDTVPPSAFSVPCCNLADQFDGNPERSNLYAEFSLEQHVQKLSGLFSSILATFNLR